MNSSKRFDGLAVLLGPILVLISIPALAVVQHRMDFPDAQDIQSATLVLDGSGESVTGDVHDEDGQKFVLFILPDGSEGKSATASVVVDGSRQSYALVIGQPTPTMGAGGDRLDADSGWFFGPGASVGSLSSDFASVIAQQSATDASALLTTQGFTNVMPTSSADDNAIAWSGLIEVGYQFPDDSRLSLDARTVSVSDFDLSAGATADIPNTTSVASAESIATADLDIWSINLNYSRFFTPTSNFGFAVSVGNVWMDRASSFNSTLSVDGVPFDTFSGGETLDDTALQYSVGLQWTNRQARGNWIPTIGIRFLQSDDIKILDREDYGEVQLYLIADFISKRYSYYEN